MKYEGMEVPNSAEMMERISFQLRRDSMSSGPLYRLSIWWLCRQLGHWHGADSGHLPEKYEIVEIAYLPAEAHWPRRLFRTYAFIDEQPNRENPDKFDKVWVEWDATMPEPVYGMEEFAGKVKFWRGLPPLPNVGGSDAKAGDDADGRDGAGAGGSGGAAEAGRAADDAAGSAPAACGLDDQRAEAAGGAAALQQQGVRPAAPAAVRGAPDGGEAGAPARKLPPVRPIGGAGGE